MTATSHRIFNLSAAIALSFHWWVWLLFLLDRLDQQLNKTYREVVAKTHKDRVCLVREGQRAWIKHRDEGVKFYVSLFPQAERERRRLQFNGDATAARIEELPEEWE